MPDVPQLPPLDFDIDAYLAPFIPTNRLNRLSQPISHFLGYRSAAPEKPLGNVVVAAWSFLGCFIGILAVSGLFMAPFIREQGGPVIVGSFVSKARFLVFYVPSHTISFLSHPIPSRPVPSNPIQPNHLTHTRTHAQPADPASRSLRTQVQPN